MRVLDVGKSRRRERFCRSVVVEPFEDRFGRHNKVEQSRHDGRCAVLEVDIDHVVPRGEFLLSAIFITRDLQLSVSPCAPLTFAA